MIETMSSTAAERKSYVYYGLLVVVVIGAAWLRFDGLTRRDLWLDESCTFYWVHHLFAWPAEGPNPWHEPAHLPYFFLLREWTRFTGETAWGLRSFSALAGCAAVVVMAGLGRRVGGRRVGVVAAALAAVHPLHVYYSQEARAYALWSLVLTLAVLFLYEAVRSQRLRWWWAYGATAWLAVLTHYYTIFWLPATVAFIIVAGAGNRRRAVRQWFTTHAVLAVALGPVVWWLVLPYAQTGPKGWMRQVWVDYPPLLAIPQSLWALLPSGGYPGYLGSLAATTGLMEARLGDVWAMAMRWGSVAIAGILTVLGAWFAWHRARGRRDSSGTEPDADPIKQERRALAATIGAGAMSLGFLLIAWTYAALMGRGYVVGRYDLAAWPTVVLGLAVLIGFVSRALFQVRIGATVLATLFTAGLLTCGWMTCLAGQWSKPNHDVSRRAQRVAEVVGEDDLLISMGLYRWFLAFEWHRVSFAARVISFPPTHDRQLCWQDAEEELADPARMAEEVSQVVAEIERALSTGTHVWLLAQGEPKGPRWEVDRRFFQALREHRIEVRLQDSWLGLATLVRSGTDEGGS